MIEYLRTQSTHFFKATIADSKIVTLLNAFIISYFNESFDLSRTRI